MLYKSVIIGLGQIGMGYDLALNLEEAVYSHARAFSLHPSFDLIGAVDPIRMKRDLFTKNYSQPAYLNIASLLQVHKPDVFVIASPTDNHNLALQEILVHLKPKAILCEKPLSYNLEQAREMVNLCERAGIKLFVNYMRRADPGVIEIKKRIESGQIALPIKGVVWYSKGFIHNGSHFFNLLEFWLGSFVKAKILNPGRLWNEKDPEPDVEVEFEKGKVVFMVVWEESYSYYTIELLSPSGRLSYEQEGGSIAWQSIQEDLKFSGYKILQTKPELIKNDMNRYQLNVLNQLVNALESKAHTLSTGKESLETLEAMYSIINKREL